MRGAGFVLGRGVVRFVGTSALPGGEMTSILNPLSCHLPSPPQSDGTRRPNAVTLFTPVIDPVCEPQ